MTDVSSVAWRKVQKKNEKTHNAVGNICRNGTPKNSLSHFNNTAEEWRRETQTGERTRLDTEKD
jgi:hypothetical protein